MTITPILWYRPNKNNEFFIKIRISDRDRVKYVNLKIAIPRRYWNKGKVSRSHPDATRLNELINDAVYKLGQQHLSTKTQSLVGLRKPEVTSRSIDRARTVGDVLKFFIEEFDANGKIGSSKKHKVVLKHAQNSGIDIIGLNEFDTSHINKFRQYLTDVANVQPQGRHTYEKVIKKVFNRSIEFGILQTRNPYSGMRMKVPKPNAPRHLGKYELHVMEERLIYQKQNLNPTSIALSMFLFSSYSYGMRFGDVATLRWSNIEDMKLSYRMKKTDQSIVLSITTKHANLIKCFLPETLYPKIFEEGRDKYDKELEEQLSKKHPIVKLEREYYNWKLEFIRRISRLPEDNMKYEYVRKNNPLSDKEKEEFKKVVLERDKELMRLIRKQSVQSRDYIFPLIDERVKSLTAAYNEISSKNVIVNKALKDFAKRQNWSPFSFHASRHTFSNNIRDVEPDILKISRMLGHKSLTLTQEYLKRFERLEDYTSNRLFIGLHDDFLLMTN